MAAAVVTLKWVAWRICGDERGMRQAHVKKTDTVAEIIDYMVHHYKKKEGHEKRGYTDEEIWQMVIEGQYAQWAYEPSMTIRHTSSSV